MNSTAEGKVGCCHRKKPQLWEWTGLHITNPNTATDFCDQAALSSKPGPCTVRWGSHLAFGIVARNKDRRNDDRSPYYMPGAQPGMGGGRAKPIACFISWRPEISLANTQSGGSQGKETRWDQLLGMQVKTILAPCESWDRATTVTPLQGKSPC